jgi:hypothetical protein
MKIAPVLCGRCDATELRQGIADSVLMRSGVAILCRAQAVIRAGIIGLLLPATGAFVPVQLGRVMLVLIFVKHGEDARG